MKRILLLLLLSSSAVWAQGPKPVQTQLNLLKAGKLNYSDSGLFVRKLINYRLMSAGEVSKLASLPATAPDLATYINNRLADLQAATNPANILQNTAFRFVSDVEKAVWNSKQPALGFTPYNSSNPNDFISLSNLSAIAPMSFNTVTGQFNLPQASSAFSGYLSLTDWILFNNKQNALGFTPLNAGSNLSDLTNVGQARTTMGINNVLNIDATNPVNIVQNASYRFVSDIEKGLWNNKLTQLQADGLYLPSSYVPSYSSLSGRPTTASGFGLTDVPTFSQTRQITSDSLNATAIWFGAGFSGDGRTPQTALSVPVDNSVIAGSANPTQGGVLKLYIDRGDSTAAANAAAALTAQTGLQNSIDNAQTASINQHATDIGNRLLSSDYLANRTTDQAALSNGLAAKANSSDLSNALASQATVDGGQNNTLVTIIGSLTALNSSLQSQINALNGKATPSSPTASVVDDIANTFGWTNSSFGGLTIADYEITQDFGGSYAVATANPTAIGDVARSTGQVGVRVSANASRNVSTTLYSTAAFTLSVTPLNTPTLASSGVTATGATLTWNSVTSATTYILQRDVVSGFTAPITVYSGSGLSYAQTGLNPSTTYYYRLQVTGGAGTSASGYGTTSFTTSALPVLAAPTNLVATSAGASAISVSLTASPNATSYQVDYATTSGFSSFSSVTTSALSTTITSLPGATTFYVRATALASGYTSSVYSNTASAATTGSFVAERTFRVNFSFSTSGVTNAGWNQLKPTSTQISTPNSYTSGTLLTETGVASGLTVSLVNNFTLTTGSSATTTSGSLYAQNVNTNAWLTNSVQTTGGTFTINNLTAGKYYQFYFLSVGNANATVQYTVGGTVKTKQAQNNYGVGGGAEFDPNTSLVYFYNQQADANGKILVNVKYVSGTSSPLNAMVIRESSVTYP